MTQGARIREERQRLGLNQTAFAQLAGSSRRAMVNWESGDSSPLITALTAWADAGADALYILTGRRSAPDRDANIPARQIEDQLAELRRDLLEPTRHKRPGETEKQAEEQDLASVAAQLNAIIRYDQQFISEETREEVDQLLAAATNPANLALLRAADFARNRARRREMKERLAGWFSPDYYKPADGVITLLAALALDYSVPVKFLVELVQELHDDDVRGLPRNPRDLGKMEPAR